MQNKYLHYPVHALSGGNKKKLSIAVANLGSPRMLLLDECTSGIDPVSAELVINYLLTLEPRQGLLFASHRIDECTRVCGRVVMLDQGRRLIDTDVRAFDDMANLFYQVDVVMPKSTKKRAAIATTKSSKTLSEEIRDR